MRGGGGHTKSYVLLFIGHEKSEFSQEKVQEILQTIICRNPV